MNRFPSGVLIAYVCVSLCLGCTVKENRELCPSYLMLDFSEVDAERWPSLEVSVSSPDGFLFKENVGYDRYEEFVIEIPKSKIFVNVYSTSNDWFEDGKGLVIPKGKECPEIFLFSSSLYSNGGLLADTVQLHKNWCLLSLNVISGSEPVDFTMEIDGCVNGYGLDGKPSTGEFAVDLSPGEKGYCSFRLPRQQDNDLILRIKDNDRALREFALGDYIESSGYDWTSPDLEDIQMTVDFAHTQIQIIVGGWEKTTSFEIEI